MIRLITLITIIIVSIQVYSQPFAPAIVVPANPDNDPDISLATMFIKAIKIPDKNIVGIEAYPGSEILQTTNAQKPMVASVRLISSDEIQKVYEFYKLELKEWNYDNFHGMHIFYKGSDKNAALSMGAPVVTIEEATLWMKVAPEAKTTILVGYE